MKRFWIISFFAVLFSLNLKAEYRVFTLQITNSQTNQVIQFDSTLDPEQYVSFYPIKAVESINYINTWRCPGDTSQNRPLCVQEAPF